MSESARGDFDLTACRQDQDEYFPDRCRAMSRIVASSSAGVVSQPNAEQLSYHARDEFVERKRCAMSPATGQFRRGGDWATTDYRCRRAVPSLGTTHDLIRRRRKCCNRFSLIAPVGTRTCTRGVGSRETVLHLAHDNWPRSASPILGPRSTGTEKGVDECVVNRVVERRWHRG
jgi:hypothetical protein